MVDLVGITDLHEELACAKELLRLWEQEATDRAKKELKRGLPGDVECFFNPTGNSLLGRTRRFLGKPPEPT